MKIFARWKYRKIYPIPAGNMEFRLHGFGIDEKYRLGVVRRPHGLPDEYLLAGFKTPVICSGKMLSENSAMLFPPGTPHAFGLENETWIHSWIIFSCSSKKLPAQCKENFYPCLMPHLNYLAELDKLHIADGFMIDSVMQNILHSFQSADNRFVRRSSIISKTLPELLAPGPSPALEKLANSCNMSVTGYSENFKGIYGTSPIQYRLHSMLTEAKKLILETDMTIAEIADALGFCSPYYLSRQFRLKFGVSPRQMRSRND